MVKMKSYHLKEASMLELLSQVVPELVSSSTYTAPLYTCALLAMNTVGLTLYTVSTIMQV